MSFMYTHMWFHLALFYGDLYSDPLYTLQKLSDIYHHHLWPPQLPHSPTQNLNFPRNDRLNSQDQISSILLLWHYDIILDFTRFIQSNNPDSPISGIGSVEEKINNLQTSVGVYKDYESYLEIPTPHWDPLHDLLLLYILSNSNSSSNSTDSRSFSSQNPDKSVLETKNLLDIMLDSMKKHHIKVVEGSENKNDIPMLIQLADAIVGYGLWNQAYNNPNNHPGNNPNSSAPNERVEEAKQITDDKPINPIEDELNQVFIVLHSIFHSPNNPASPDNDQKIRPMNAQVILIALLLITLAILTNTISLSYLRVTRMMMMLMIFIFI